MKASSSTSAWRSMEHLLGIKWDGNYSYIRYSVEMTKKKSIKEGTDMYLGSASSDALLDQS